MNARTGRRAARAVGVVGIGTATALAGTVTPATAVTGTAAPAAAQMAAAQTAASRTTVTSRVDIDGDGRGDVTTLRSVSVRDDVNTFVLTVRTAKGRTATMPLRIESFGTLKPSEVWMGATGIDGVRGNEVVLDLSGGLGDFRWIHAFAWRNGKLAAVPAPGNARRDYSWHELFPPFSIAGYTFSMRGDTRYVVKHEMNRAPSGRSYSGWNTTYRWTRTGWVQVSRTRTGSIPTAVASKKYVGLHGLIWR